MRYPMKAKSYEGAKKELLLKVRQGIIPPGEYRLVNFMSLNDYDNHWYAERL